MILSSKNVPLNVTMVDIPLLNAKELKRFENSYMPEPNSGCHLWIKSINTGGYGVFKIRGRSYIASRVSYRIHNGPVPQGMRILHRCDLRCCSNFDHLFLGTHQDNSRDEWKKGRNPWQTDPERNRCPLEKNVFVKNPERTQGVNHHNARLTEDQVREIRQLYATGNYTLDALGTKFGVRDTQISRIASFTRWKNVK